MTADKPIARLRCVAAALEAREHPSTDDAVWIATAIRSYEASPADTTLDRVLGLTPTPGQEHWRTTEARSRRDATIAKLRILYFGDLPNAQAARLIYQMARRLQNTAWQSPQADPRAQLIADALSLGLSFPGERQLQTIFMKSIGLYSFQSDRGMVLSIKQKEIRK